MIDNRAKEIIMRSKCQNIFSLTSLIILVFSMISCRTSQPNIRVDKADSSLKVRETIVKEAAKYQGTPYKAAGKTPKGFDCSGYTAYVFKQFDIELSASSALQAQQGKEVSLKNAKAGDLIFFGRNGRSGKVMHVGIVSKNRTEGLYMWHSSSSKGIIETNVSQSAYWKPKILYVRRVL